MITESDIAECLLDVDEEKLAELLRDEECFHTSLVKAMVAYAAFGGDVLDANLACIACANAVQAHQYRLAKKLAQDKDDARRFQAEMKDKFQ